MKLDIKFPELEKLVKEVGATPVEWKSDAPPLPKLKFKDFRSQRPESAQDRDSEKTVSGKKEEEAPVDG